MSQIILNSDFIGIICLLLVISIFVAVAFSRPNLFLIIILALIVRVLTIFLNEFVPLPDSWGDADNFLKTAAEWSSEGFFNVYKYYPGLKTFFISWVIAFPFSIFGPSKLVAQSMSLFFGMYTVILGTSIAYKITDDKSAKIAGFILALFPTLILYSCLVLREAYVCFFLLLAINGLIDFINKKNFISLISIVIGFTGAYSFHGAMIAGPVFLFMILIFTNIRVLIASLYRQKLNYINIIFIFFIIFLFISLSVVSIDFNNEYVGSLTNIGQKFDLIIERSKGYHDGSAKYPDWLVPNNRLEVLFKSPFRIIYFLFAPFPWDLSKISHIIGMLDGFLYMFFTYFIFKNLKYILNDKILKIIFWILIGYIIVYGIGVGNFGTGIRHRSKFIVLIIILAAPFIPKFVFFNKNKLKK